MRKWSGSASFVPPRGLIAAMQIRQEPMGPSGRRGSLAGAGPKIRRTELRQNSVLPGLKIDVQQGIA
jgi:hypothetical protein